MTTQIAVDTDLGPGRITVDAPPQARIWFLLGHGAGGGITAVDLVWLAAGLPAQGIGVARYEQPWRVAGKPVAPAPARLDAGWLPAVEVLRAAHSPRVLIVGGRSAGARVACRTARDVGADGVLACAFPLHPPGRPDRSRLAELQSVTIPVVAVQGTRDAFGTAAELAQVAPQVEILPAPDADHGMRTPARSPVELVRAAVLDGAARVVKLAAGR